MHKVLDGPHSLKPPPIESGAAVELNGPISYPTTRLIEFSAQSAREYFLAPPLVARQPHPPRSRHCAERTAAGTYVAPLLRQAMPGTVRPTFPPPHPQQSALLRAGVADRGATGEMSNQAAAALERAICVQYETVRVGERPVTPPCAAPWPH